MIKVPLGVAAIALVLALGAPSLSADEWRGDTTEYRVHNETRHYYPAAGHSWREHEHSDRDGYARHAIYTAGFNAGARAQWRIAYRRWLYEYAAYRQWRGPTGIFALAAGLGTSFGYGARYGYGRHCDCE